MPSGSTRADGVRWFRLPEYAHVIAAENPGSVLLETSRFDPSNQQSYLFLNPRLILSASELVDIPRLFAQIEEALALGLHVAGFLSYECGYHFEQCAPAVAGSPDLPLAWFGVYEKPFVFDHARGSFQGDDLIPTREKQTARSLGPISNNLALEITQDAYYANILKIKKYIAAGDTYQVNFTDEVLLPNQTPPAVLFESLLKNQSVAYAAMMNVAGQHILSFSPELFFRTHERHIVTRPMKGTMPRGLDATEDARAALRLQNDEKNRSEHVMIVDLLRNDLGRICTMGSIRVEDLFSVEKYETLLQMTSTVAGTLRPGITYYDIFRSMFPCGSVTGAPKIRTMEIIRELERHPRGVYTGAIGFIAPNGASVFNVAIRTLVMKDRNIQMGVGGGIVADSDPGDEHRECLLKAAFLTRAPHGFQLIETMRWEDEFSLLSLHLDRLESSAFYFNFPFARSSVLSRLYEYSNSLMAGEPYRIRLLLDGAGDVRIESSEFRLERSTGSVKLSAERTSSTDVFTRHKTTRRQMYDRQYAEARTAGFDEVLFTNERGEVTEGAISNLFIEQGGKLMTPPLTCGLLPGVFRRNLLEICPTAEERILTVEDLKTADAIFLCNSLRGMRRVKLRMV